MLGLRLRDHSLATKSHGMATVRQMILVSQFRQTSVLADEGSSHAGRVAMS